MYKQNMAFVGSDNVQRLNNAMEYSLTTLSVINLTHGEDRHARNCRP